LIVRAAPTSPCVPLEFLDALLLPGVSRSFSPLALNPFLD
jgi:hypothetical protein